MRVVLALPFLQNMLIFLDDIEIATSFECCPYKSVYCQGKLRISLKYIRF